MIKLRIVARITEIKNIKSSEISTRTVKSLPKLPKRTRAQVINAKLPVDLHLKI